MDVDIRGRHLDVTARLRTYVARRLRFALGRLAPRLRRIAVRLEDVNGPRGGVDKRCHVEVTMRGRTITIKELDRDLYAAVDRAADRAGRAALRALGRRRAA